MIITIAYIILMWSVGPRSKIYWCLAGIPTLILFFISPITGTLMAIKYLILIPLIVTKMKPIIQPKIDRLLNDVHTLTEEARKKEP